MLLSGIAWWVACERNGRSREPLDRAAEIRTALSHFFEKQQGVVDLRVSLYQPDRCCYCSEETRWKLKNSGGYFCGVILQLQPGYTPSLEQIALWRVTLTSSVAELRVHPGLVTLVDTSGRRFITTPPEKSRDGVGSQDSFNATQPANEEAAVRAGFGSRAFLSLALER